MFNIGFVELLILSILALVLIGPKQLPQIARVVGRTINEIKRAADDLTGDFLKSARSDDFKKTTDKILESINSLKDVETHPRPRTRSENENLADVATSDEGIKPPDEIVEHHPTGGHPDVPSAEPDDHQEPNASDTSAAITRIARATPDLEGAPRKSADLKGSKPNLVIDQKPDEGES